MSKIILEARISYALSRMFSILRLLALMKPRALLIARKKSQILPRIILSYSVSYKTVSTFIEVIEYVDELC